MGRGYKIDHIVEAAQAHTNLNVFASVVSILEGGHLYGAYSDRAAQRIIEICKSEQVKCLARFDAARAAVSRATPSTARNGERT